MASTIDSTLNGDLTTTGQTVQKAELKQQFDAAVTDIEALQDGTGIATDAVDTANIQDEAVTNAKLAHMAADTIKGRANGAGTGDATDLTATQVRTIINVESGADVTDATNVATATAVMEGDTTIAAMSFVLDEDDMATDSATKLATQQSIKAYVDATEAGPLVDIAANKTLLLADNNGRALVDASAATRTLTLPLKSTLSAGWFYRIFLDADPGTNNVVLNHNASDSAGAEFWTGVEENDYIDVLYNGTNFLAAREYSGHFCRVFIGTSEVIAQGVGEHVVTISETTDVGDIWNTTNDEVDIPFDCWIDLTWNIIGTDVVPTAKLDTVYIRDLTAIVGATPSLTDDASWSVKVAGNSGAKLELWAFNIDNNGGNKSALDTASFATIKLTRRR